MPVPKRKTSKRRRDNRRAHDAIRTPNLSACPSCHHLRPPHQVCPNCGTYDGEQIIKVEEEKKE